MVSVIVPVYYADHQVFLNCIRSIIGQTEKQIEIIVIFDGTRMFYEKILKDPIFRDERLKLEEIEHKGVSAARNRGMELAKGQWILFADADDRLSNKAVELLLKGTDGQTDFVIGDYFIKTSEKMSAHSYKKEEVRFFLGNKAEFMEDILNPQSGMGFCWGKLYRRDRILAHDLGFNEDLEMAEDAEFVLKYVMYAREICYIPRAVYFYQINPSSAVRRFRPDYAQQYEKAMDCIFHTIADTRYENQLKEAYQTCVLYHFLLITVNYSFHPEQAKSRKEKIAEYIELTKKPLYAEAIHRGRSCCFSLSRRISVWLIRMHFWRAVYAVAWIRQKQLGF